MRKTVGQIIREARIKAGMTQKELAAKIVRKEESPGEEKGIAPQYLNDIEHGRRTPPEYIIRQITKHLNLDRDKADHLVFLAGSVPADILESGISEQAVKEAVRLFRKSK
jgi:transcriptional regulator with XRE-family HTH domain